jgi:acetolactate synthase-1/2/3 large subunit
VLGTSLFNPDFKQLASAFGMQAQRVSRTEDISGAVKRGLAGDGPHFIEFKASLALTLPPR